MKEKIQQYKHFSLFEIIYLLVNILFLFKYGIRQSYISIYILITIYSLFCGFLLFKNPVKNFALYERNKINLFKVICITVAILIFGIVFFTDGTKLNVDRWSAMDVGVKALLNGDYPYTATDHLNGRTSNFPGLIILGIPFYLLGNVGYLQVFAFLLLSYTLYKTVDIDQAIKYLLFLLISPAFWWEIFAISDLLSNIIIVFCFILLVKNKYKDNVLNKPIIMGISTSFLALTRGIAAIPLIVFVFKDFIKLNFKGKLKYAISFLLTFILLILLVIINCPSLETLKNFNPLNLQTSHLPFYLNIIALILPFYSSLKIKNFNNDFFKYCIYLMFVPPFLAFINSVNNLGFQTIIFENKFDLSYLSMVYPFLIYEITKKENYKKL